MHVIHDMADIPDFASEAEEAAFWDTHTLSPELISAAATHAAAELLPLMRERPATSRAISVLLGPDLERRLHVLAERKGATTQILLKEFILERVYEEEKRLNII